MQYGIICQPKANILVCIGLTGRLKGIIIQDSSQQRRMTLDFWELFVLEGLLLLASGAILIGGVRGALAGTVLMSSIAWFTHPKNFWSWEIPFLIGVAFALGILLLLARKAGKSDNVSGLVGGMASMVVFGAFMTPLLALFLWALIIGTGLIPRLRVKQVLWGFAPVVWRLLMGIGWVIYGNFLI